MTIVTPKFLRDVQEKGWLIKGADQEAVLAGCPRAGCGLKVTLKPERSIPDTCRPGRDLAEVAVRTFEDARVFLKARRAALCLTIKEAEEIAGMTVDYMAKFEKDNPSKIPNTETFLDWAQSLGYEVVLRPATLPPKALSYIANSRDQLKTRKRMAEIHARRKMVT